MIIYDAIIFTNMRVAWVRVPNLPDRSSVDSFCFTSPQKTVCLYKRTEFTFVKYLLLIIGIQEQRAKYIH
jgi:hypothetical protein